MAYIDHLLVCHRGYSAVYPENTLLAFEKAVEMGVNCIELDVQRTKDGVLVCLHDTTVDRTTNGSGNIANLNYDVVQSLDAGSWKNAAYTGEKIPRLSDVLDRFQFTGVFVLIELKNDNNYKGIEEEIVAMIKQRRMEEQCLYFSFDWASVDKVKGIDKKIRTGLLGSGTTNITLARDRALKNGHEFISWNTANLTQAYITQWQQAGLYTNVWTANTSTDINTFLDRGCNMISSDYADLLMNANNQRNKTQDTAKYRLHRKSVVKVYRNSEWVPVDAKAYKNGWKFSDIKV